MSAFDPKRTLAARKIAVDPRLTSGVHNGMWRRQSSHFSLRIQIGDSTYWRVSFWLGSQPAKGITMAKEETRPGRSTNPAGSEFFTTLQEMRRDWMARATAEIELSLKLSKKLEAADSVPDTLAAYQEWLNEEMGARAEDARLLMSNGQKFTDATSRFLSSGWTNVGMTT
jgi:hypothetical protein